MAFDPTPKRGYVSEPAVPALVPLVNVLSPLGQPLVRVTAGLFAMPHGAQKLFGLFGGHGLVATGQSFAENLGLHPGFLWALAAGLIEFFGGACLALGLFTRAAAALLTGLLLFAAFWVHLGNGFFWNQGGVEYPLLWGLVCFSFVLRGGGTASLDQLMRKEL